LSAGQRHRPADFLFQALLSAFLSGMGGVLYRAFAFERSLIAQ
jgi:hypothetical protein